MRTIKFRVWHKHHKMFKYPDLWDGSMPSNWEKHYILQQFTGLKDKNGVEVWEGDIFHVGYNHLGNMVCEMVNGQWNFARFNHRKIRVVGNIHENPELL